LKVAIFSTNDFPGAGHAAIKVLNAIKKRKIQSRLFVRFKKYKISEKLKLDFISKNRLIAHDFLSKIIKYFYLEKKTRSFDFFSFKISNIINKLNFDIIQLHWINNFLSLKDIEKINKPIVWRFSDMWPILGSEHYSKIKSGKKDFFNFEKDLKKKKREILNKNINIVAPSKWLFKIIKKNKIVNLKKIHFIPTPINHLIFKKKKISKKKYKKKFVILFLAKYFDERKGSLRLINIINFINYHYNQKFFFILVGKLNINIKNNLPYNVDQIDFIDNQKKLVEVYNLADAYFCTSIHDNLPQTVLESLMCGTPVICFKNSGVEEIIKNKNNGMIINKFTSQNVKKCLNFLIVNKKKDNLKKISDNCIKYAKKQFSEKVIGKKFHNLYKKILLEKNTENEK
jgi:glycosyltransferase involved in cell wall biosynthesis